MFEILISWLVNLTGLLIILFGAFYVYSNYSYQYWKKLGVPYIEPQLFYGNFVKSFKGQIPFDEELVEWYNVMKAKGHKHVGVYLFTKANYVPIDVELIKRIMAKDFQHFVDRGMYYNEEDDPLSANLFSLNGLQWKNLRAKLTPTFTSGKLKKMFQTLVDCSTDLSNYLNEPISKDEPINIRNILAQYTTDVIGSCGFGIECNSFKDPNTDFIRIGRRVFEPTYMEKIKVFFVIAFPKIAELLKMSTTNAEVDVFFRGLVKDTIEYREKNNITRNDFMHLLIQLRNNRLVDDEETSSSDCQIKPEVGTTLTLNEIAAQAFLFFVAGFETSSTTMTFCLLELSLNQHIQYKLREEIIRVLNQHDGKITYDSIMAMHYMDRVIQEALRKYPPVMALQRVCTKDYKIPETDIVLKKGIHVLISVLGLQRDPEFYPDPLKFEPERFTEENKSTRPDYTYIPFGDGPRVCIGFRFAMMQVKVGLCRLLLNYKFKVHPKTELPVVFEPTSFIASVKNGVWLSAEKVTN